MFVGNSESCNPDAKQEGVISVYANKVETKHAEA